LVVTHPFHPLVGQLVEVAAVITALAREDR